LHRKARNRKQNSAVYSHENDQKRIGGLSGRFINNLSHTKGKWAGESFQLRPWQEKIIRELFGTLQPDGRRQYQTCFGFLPRKNGKSELAAAIALYCLLSEPEFGGEIYSAAADRDQASLVFNTAAAMVRADSELSNAYKIIDSQKRIVNPSTGSFYRAISSESHTKHGYNPSVVIFDEIHYQPNRDLWDVLSTGMGSREQPLMIGVTTAGYEKNLLAYELCDYALKVRDGIIDDPTFLPVMSCSVRRPWLNRIHDAGSP
jgi:phage terminase large subunit-like protein